MKTLQQKLNARKYCQTQEYKVKRKAYLSLPHVKAKIKVYNHSARVLATRRANYQTPERKEKVRKYNQTPQRRAHVKAWRQNPRYILKRRKRDNAPRLAIMNHLGLKCIRCGFLDIRALQLDHIHGGGRIEVKQFDGALKMYLYYSQNLDEVKGHFQVLCSNCNWIKKYEENQTRK